jgi:hypothetical protein
MYQDQEQEIINGDAYEEVKSVKIKKRRESKNEEYSEYKRKPRKSIISTPNNYSHIDEEIKSIIEYKPD